MHTGRIVAILAANAFTASRGLVGIFIPYALYYQTSPLGTTDYRIAALAMAIAGTLSDAIDGAIAKIGKGQSRFGGLFDPFCDTVFCFGIAAGIMLDAGVTLYAICFYWVPTFLAGIHTCRMAHMRWTGKVTVTNWRGRFGVGCMMFAAIAILGRIAFDNQQMELSGIAAILIGLLIERDSFGGYHEEDAPGLIDRK